MNARQSTLTRGPPFPFIVSPGRCEAGPASIEEALQGAAMAIRQSDAVEVKRVKGKGRGVFARRAIRKGEVFETCPVLVLPGDSIEDFSMGIGPYVFRWGEGKLALALGFGSLYNHSYRPNARYLDVGPRTKAFEAIREIAAGEEVTVNYNGVPSSRKRVWFDVVKEGGKRQGADPA